LKREIEVLRSQFSKLESRSSTVDEWNKSGEGDVLSIQEKKRYEDIIVKLSKENKEREERINDLLNMQEAQINETSEIIRRERRAREEAELELRSQLATAQGNTRKEKERAQKLMKTMAEMQSADPYKLDNNNIKDSVKELRYSIRNWASSQRLLLSQPQPGRFATYMGMAVGRERGPVYDFLESVTPNFHEYTGNHQDFKYLLQAYVWKQIVELVIYDDLWAGLRKSINDQDSEYKMIVGYRALKSRLQPGEPLGTLQIGKICTNSIIADEHASKEYVEAFHEWRSNTARLLDKRLSDMRRKVTVDIIRDEIVLPLVKAVSAPDEQEIRDVEDLETIIESAMKLGAQLAQQRANLTFEAMPVDRPVEFQRGMMADPWPAQQFDSRTHFRAVVLTIAPRLLKYGTSEGTNFDTATQLIEAEVETKIMPKKYVPRRSVPG
jgi:hypothetical protein